MSLSVTKILIKCVGVIKLFTISLLLKQNRQKYVLQVITVITVYHLRVTLGFYLCSEASYLLSKLNKAKIVCQGQNYTLLASSISDEEKSSITLTTF